MAEVEELLKLNNPEEMAKEDKNPKISTNVSTVIDVARKSGMIVLIIIKIPRIARLATRYTL